MYYENGPMMEIWPRPKLGDKFEVMRELKENWFLEFLRRIHLRHKPRARKTIIHTVTKVFPDVDWEPKI